MTTVLPTWLPQTTYNACLPTTLAMLAHTDPDAVTAVAGAAYGWDPERGMSMRSARPLAEAMGLHLGEGHALNLPHAAGTYLAGVDAGRLYAPAGTPAPFSPHAVAIVVPTDGAATVRIYDGRQSGPILKSRQHTARAIRLAVSVTLKGA